MTEQVLTMEQLEELLRYVSEHGRYWKRDLLAEWERALCTPPLMQLRNTLGPSWLMTFRLTDIDGRVLPKA